MTSWRIVSSAALLLAGCYASHGLSREGAPDGAVGHTATSAPPAASAPAVCLPPSSAVFHLGLERECERRTFELAPTFACRNQSDMTTTGVPVRIFRVRPGRVDVRIYDDECSAHARIVEDLDCGWCTRQVPVSETFIPQLGDDGLFEMLLFSQDSPRPCGVVDVEVCFDPDYGEPAWDG